MRFLSFVDVEVDESKLLWERLGATKTHLIPAAFSMLPKRERV